MNPVFYLLACIALIGITPIHTLPLTDRGLFSIDALDCRNPRQIRTGLLSNICETNAVAEPTEKEDVLILQYADKKTINGYRCQKSASRVREICGSFSHSKIFEPMDILDPMPITAEECEGMVHRWTYVKEDGNSILIAPNRKYTYKYIAHGGLTYSSNNVACTGATVTINGETKESIVELVSAEVLVQEITIEVGQDSAIDLDAHYTLPYQCVSTRSCVVGEQAYVLNNAGSSCNLYKIRTLPMQRINIETTDGSKTALLSREHKVFFVLGITEPAVPGCAPLDVVQRTNYAHIKVVLKEHAVAEVPSMDQYLTASMLDLELELKTSAEYLAFMFEETMQKKLKQVGKSVCKMSQHGLGSTEISPFHPDSLLKLRGDLIQELTCTRVQVEARLGERRSDNCYLDAFPAWLHTQPIFIQAETHLVIEAADISTVSCESKFQPVFVTADQKTLLVAAPEVKIVNIALTHIDQDYLHILDDSQIMHTSFNEDLLYTPAEMTAFNDLLHFQRTSKRVVSAMVAQYCADNDGCGDYKPANGYKTFNLDDLKDKIMGPFAFFYNWKEEISTAGNYCSILIMLFVIISTIYKMGHVLHLACKRKLGFKQAVKLGLFINHTMIDALVVDPHPRTAVEEIPLNPVKERGGDTPPPYHIPESRDRYQWSPRAIIQ